VLSLPDFKVELFWNGGVVLAGCHVWFMWLVVNLCLLLGEISIALTTELLQFDGCKLFVNLQEVLSIYLLFVPVY